MTETLKILRQAGFFKYYNSLTDDEILDKIHVERMREHSKIFGYEYDPGRNLSDQQLASQDSRKVLHFDLEADVCKENKVYTWLLQRLNELSGIDNLITEVIEEWESETGPIKLSYKLNDEKNVSQPEYLDDWVDQTFIDMTLEKISKVINEPFHICLGPDEDWLGQDVSYMRLTTEEREILEEKLNWKFFDEFLKRMRK
jgi:hypothetical protein